MNRNTVIFAVVVLAILAILGGYLVARNNQVGSPSTTTTTPNTNTSTPAPSNGQNTSEAQAVSIKDMAFTPASITVKKGTTVTWTNDDAVAHTVVETDGQTGPDSATIQPKGTYAFTYNTTGTFRYHCSIHPNMTGTVVVTQ